MSEKKKLLIVIPTTEETEHEAVNFAKELLKDNYPTFPYGITVVAVDGDAELKELWGGCMTDLGLVETVEVVRRRVAGDWIETVTRIRREWDAEDEDSENSE